jgi:F0F1-type ATP synthase epsilon subunit
LSSPGGEQQKFLVQGGVLDVKNTHDHDVVILADQEIAIGDADYDAEIKRAQEAMKLNQDDLDFAFEESAIERNLFLKRLKKK